MPRISTARRQERRDQIARAAVSEFLTNGIHSTSMASIIGASGLSSGSIYTHFASKDAIVSYVATRAVESVLDGVDRLRAQLRPASPSELFETLIRTMSQSEPPARLVVQVWGEAVVNVAIRQLANDMYTRVQATLAEQIQEWASSGGIDVASSARLASERSRLMVGLIYAHIIRLSLLDNYDWRSSVAEARPVLDAR